MNEKKRLLSLALALSLGISMGSAIAEGDYSIKRYPGEAEYRQKYQNINFRDMDGHWARDAVFTMGSLGIVKGTGGGNYVPRSTITKEEALILIVRIMGLEKEAQAEGIKMAKERDAAGYNVLDPYHYTVMGAVSVAESAGIIDTKELPNINPVTAATTRAIDAEVASGLARYQNRNLTEAQLKNIEELLRERAERRYTWSRPISREVTAYWLGRAISPEGITGPSQQAISTFRDWASVKEKYFPYIEAVLQKGYMVGDNLNRFNPQGTLTRGEMAQIIYNTHEDKLKDQGYTIEAGKIVDISFENGTENGESVRRRIVKIRNADNETIEVYGQVSDQNKPEYEKGISTYINGVLSNHQSLAVGQTVQYYIRPTGEVPLIAGAMDSEKYFNGKLVAVYENIALLEDSRGNVYRYPLAEEVDFSVNGSWTDIGNLVPGMEGRYFVIKGKIYKIDADAPEGGVGGGGNIAVGDYFDTGIVVSKSEAKKSLTISKDGGTTATYDLSTVPNAPVYRDGSKVAFSSIKDGDSATVFFSDTSKSIAKIVLSSHKTRAVNSIYKGKIFYYNRNRNQIRLGDASKINSVSDWEATGTEQTLDINDRADMYVTDESGTTDILISRNSFEDYSTYKEQQVAYIENALKANRDIYLYTETVNGREEITRIIVKEMGEFKYTGRVESTSNGKLSLPSNKNIYYNNSTIFLKEGRLVSSATLKSGDTATVYTHQGRSTAALVMIEGVDVTEYPFVVYSTRMVDANLVGQTVDVSGTASQKVQGSSVSSPPIETLNISTDTVIELIPEKTKLTQSEFFTRFYKDYKNAKTKIIANSTGDILSMQIYGESINRPELKDIRTAKVSQKDLSNDENIPDTVTLTDVRTWTGDSWSTGVKSMTLDFTDAIVIVNGAPSRLDRVPDGASVDVITDVNTGHTIIVR